MGNDICVGRNSKSNLKHLPSITSSINLKNFKEYISENEEYTLTRKKTNISSKVSEFYDESYDSLITETTSFQKKNFFTKKININFFQKFPKGITSEMILSIFKNYIKFTINEESEYLINMIELNDGYLFLKKKLFILFSNEAIYIYENDLKTQIKRIPWYNLKKILKVDRENYIVIIAYNSKYTNNFILKDEENLKFLLKLKGDEYQQILDIIKEIYSYYYQESLKVLSCNDEDILEGFTFDSSNIKHYTNYLSFKKSFECLIKNEEIIAIYKVRKYGRGQKFCKRILIITYSNIYSLYANKLTIKHAMKIEKISKLKLGDNRETLAIYNLREGNLFMSKRAEEISYLILFFKLILLLFQVIYCVF